MSHKKTHADNHTSHPKAGFTKDGLPKAGLTIVKSDDFRELRSRHGYFADKTAHLEHLLRSPCGPYLFTRPRRFGKSLFLSMVANFLDLSRDSSPLFEGLAISRNKELCQEWMNTCPVIELSLGAVEGPTASRAISQTVTAIRMCYSKHSYLLQSEKLSQIDKKYFNSIFDSSDPYVCDYSLNMLCMMLETHHGRKPVILLDEYDIPLRNAYNNNCFAEVRDFISPIYRSGFKDNKSLQFAILVGCTNMSKEDQLSGLNNLTCNDIDSINASDAFGFTESDVDNLLSMANLSNHKMEICEWYDGYRIGQNTHIYCPWDVLSHVEQLLKNPETPPQSYWVNSSNSQTEGNFIADIQEPFVENGIADLVSGKHVVASINSNLSHYNLHRKSNNIWSLLYFLGYLTKASDEYIKNNGILLSGNNHTLVIPNKSIHKTFMERLESWMDCYANKCDTKGLADAIKSFSSDEAESRLNDILLETISTYDYSEFMYHGLLCGLLKGPFGNNIVSNPQTGRGRADLVLRDGNVAHIIEVKRTAATDAKSLPKLAQAALEQIENREYPVSFKDCSHVACWGMAFACQSCKVVLKLLR